jgi:hypothetical protein
MSSINHEHSGILVLFSALAVTLHSKIRVRSFAQPDTMAGLARAGYLAPPDVVGKSA